MIFFDYSITKEMAERCITHHHACDCREYACRQHIEALEELTKNQEREQERLVSRLAEAIERIEALEAAALKVVETSGQVDHSGIYAYEMDYRRAIQRLAALLPGRGE